MPAVPTLIAEGVVDLLSAATLSKTFTVERTYLPDYGDDDETLPSGVTLFVLALDNAITPYDRSAHQFEYVVKVAVAAPVSKATRADTLTDMDAMTLFMQEVIDLLRAVDFVAGATLAEATNSPAYDPAQLAKHGLFVSALTLLYRTAR